MRTTQVFNFGNNETGLKAICIKFDKEFEEYLVELVHIGIDGKPFVNEEETYFTDDRDDAQATAQVMYNNVEDML